MLRAYVFGVLDALQERHREFMELGLPEKAAAVSTRRRRRVSARKLRQIHARASQDSQRLIGEIESKIRSTLLNALSTSGTLSGAQVAATIEGTVGSYLERPTENLRAFLDISALPQPPKHKEDWLRWERVRMRHVQLLKQRAAAEKIGARDVRLKAIHRDNVLRTAWTTHYSDGVYDEALEDESVEKLAYVALADACPICRAYDGTILLKRHPWWGSHRPSNHYRCRCRLKAITFEEVTEKRIRDAKELSTIPPAPGFGGDGTTFDPLLRVSPAAGGTGRAARLEIVAGRTTPTPGRRTPAAAVALLAGVTVPGRPTMVPLDVRVDRARPYLSEITAAGVAPAARSVGVSTVSVRDLIVSAPLTSRRTVASLVKRSPDSWEPIVIVQTKDGFYVHSGSAQVAAARLRNLTRIRARVIRRF
jgi:hypothetical protein